MGVYVYYLRSSCAAADAIFSNALESCICVRADSHRKVLSG